MDTMEDNNNIKVLKDELQTRQVTTEAEIVVIRGNQVIEETTLLEKIRRNRIREQEVQKKLEKDEGQAWEDDGIVYMKGNIYISNNQKIQEQIL